MRFVLMTEPQQGMSYADQLAITKRAADNGFDAFFRSDHFASFPGEVELALVLALRILFELGVPGDKLADAGDESTDIERAVATVAPGDRQLVGVGHPLLGLGHEDEAHLDSCTCDGPSILTRWFIGV